MRTFKIYACGGAGNNIVNRFLGINDEKLTETIVHVDTSDSDISNKVNKDKVFIFPVVVPGSGGVRSTNIETIKDHVDNLIKTHKPGDLNIVISSTSGGSGSVISPVLVDKLKAMEKNVILLLVSSSGSVLETSNTFKTLESFYNIASKRKSSIVTFIRNNKFTKDIDVDDSMLDAIYSLYYLWTKEYKSLDTNDLNSWLSYSDKVLDKSTLLELKIKKYSVKEVDIHKKLEEDLKEYKSIFTVLSLLPEGYNLQFPEDVIIRSNYHGFYDSTNISEPNCYLHSIVTDDLFNFYKDIKNKSSRHEEELKKQTSYSVNIDTDDDMGLVI